MNQCRLLLLIATITLCGCSRDAEMPEPVGTAITNVTIIDAENGIRENQTVVWDGDEIISVGASADAPADAPAAATVVDGSGKFLIPGLWDMHVHLIYDEAFIDDMPRFVPEIRHHQRARYRWSHAQGQTSRRQDARTRRARAARLVCRPIAGRQVRGLRR